MSLFDGIPSKEATKPNNIVKKQTVKYSDKLADAICKRISRGESIIQICASEPTYPPSPTIYSWAIDIERFPHFAIGYACANVEQAHYLADEIMQIADMADGDTYVCEKTGKIKTHHEVVARAKLRVDTRKWRASKLAPREYGDKTQIEHTGEITQRHEIPITDEMRSVMARIGVEFKEESEAIDVECEEVEE